VTADVPCGSVWLFCPADRLDRFGEAAQRCDVVILNLEDGVAPIAARDDQRIVDLN
jgi:citrate lyase subunit beta / citryl-CoA lyase